MKLQRNQTTYWKCYSLAETSSPAGIVLGGTESALQITYRPGLGCIPLYSTRREKERFMEQQQNSSLRSYCLAMSQCSLRSESGSGTNVASSRMKAKVPKYNIYLFNVLWNSAYLSDI